MTSPKLSIIIPVFNLEKYIAATLNSVFSQTFSDFEVIAVDDGSADTSAELLDDYAKTEPRLKVIHKENGGVTSARMRGIQEAKGEYIGFVDGDDTIDEDMFELLLANAEKYNADISHCGYKMVFPSRTDLYHGSGKIKEQDHITGLIDLLSGTLVEPSLWNKIYKRNLFAAFIEQTLAIPTSIRINEDLLLNYYLFINAEKSVFHDVCKYNYIIREGSAANNHNKSYKFTDPLKVSEILLDEAKDKPELQLYIYRIYVTRLIYALTYPYKKEQTFSKDVKKEASKKLFAFLKTYCQCKNERITKKLQAVFAAFLPHLYSAIHIFYKKLKGTDNLYEIK